MAPIFLKTASKIQNSNLIGWVNVIGAARALALASIMMSLQMFLALGMMCVIWEFASTMLEREREHEVARDQELAVRRLARQTASSHILPVIQNI